MPFRIIRDDITRVRADAIVNTANPEPIFAGGTDAAIYKAAGAEELLRERKRIGRVAPGEAVVTGAYALPAKYIIHTVGPAWSGGCNGEFEILRSCYRKSLLLADSLGCESIAFPLIATGVYGFPKDKALETALSVIREHTEHSDIDVTLVVFGNDSYKIAAATEERVRQYIDDNYVEERLQNEYGKAARSLMPDRRSGWLKNRRLSESVSMPSSAQDFAKGYGAALPGAAAAPAMKKASLEDAVSKLGESFQKRLLRMIDERGMTDPEVYKRANIDRKLFSKIRCSEDYIPKKRTILALSIALKLSLDDTRDLLKSAGLALTDNSKSDVIISFCIENGIYDIFEVNALLFKFGQDVLC